MSAIDVKIPIEGTRLFLVVDTLKEKCKSEMPHCHVFSEEKDVMKVAIPNCKIIYSVNFSAELKEHIIEVIRRNRYQLLDAYKHNRKLGEK